VWLLWVSHREGGRVGLGSLPALGAEASGDDGDDADDGDDMACTNWLMLFFLGNGDHRSTHPIIQSKTAVRIIEIFPGGEYPDAAGPDPIPNPSGAS